MRTNTFSKYFFASIFCLFISNTQAQTSLENTYYSGSSDCLLKKFILGIVTPTDNQISDTWIQVIPFVSNKNTGRYVSMAESFPYLTGRSQICNEALSYWNLTTFKSYAYGIIWSANRTDLPQNLDEFKNKNYDKVIKPNNCKLITNGDWKKYGLAFFVGDGTNGTSKLNPNTKYYYMFVGYGTSSDNSISDLTLGPIGETTTKSMAVTSNYAITCYPYACPNFMPIITDASTPGGTTTYTYKWTKQTPNGSYETVKDATSNSDLNSKTYQPPQKDFTDISILDPTTITYVRETTITSAKTNGYDVATITYYPSGSSAPANNLSVGGSYLVYTTKTIDNIPSVEVEAKNIINTKGFTIQWQKSSTLNGSFENTTDGVSNSVLTKPITDANYYRAILSYGCATSTTDPIQPSTIPSNTITAGTQTWMKNDQSVTKFNDGTSITPVTKTNDTLKDNWNANATTPGYYNNSACNNGAYLYNSYVVQNNKNVCPAGWHVATTSDFTTLKSSGSFSTVFSGNIKTGYINGSSVLTDDGSTVSGCGGGTGNGYWWDASLGDWYTSGGDNTNPATYTGNPLGGPAGYAIRCVKNK